jgi:hypothetical protein
MFRFNMVSKSLEMFRSSLGNNEDKLKDGCYYFGHFFYHTIVYLCGHRPGATQGEIG